MATLGVTNPTLADLVRLTDPDGSIANVVEILNETNEVLDDMTWLEGNLPTGHRTTVRSGIPAPTWRKLYGGVQPNKSRVVQVTDNCGMLEAYAEVDRALVDLAGDPAAFRQSEDRPHIEGMSQEVASTIFYGDESSAPEEFTGLAPRYSSLSADNSRNIIDAGESANLRSIWLVCWGPNTLHGIVPKGSKAGVQQRDLGEVTLENADPTTINTGRMQAYRTHYRWDAGLSVRDWRYAVRIANINRDTVPVNPAYASDTDILPDLMHQAIGLLPNMSSGRCAFYMTREMLSYLRRQTSYLTIGSTLSTENVGGTMQTSFQGIPIRRVDALDTDEDQVT